MSLVVNPVTGAQRVITQGKITAPISSSSNKLTSGGTGEDFASISVDNQILEGHLMNCSLLGIGLGTSYYGGLQLSSFTLVYFGTS